jgi:hypothetical protein
MAQMLAKRAMHLPNALDLNVLQRVVGRTGDRAERFMLKVILMWRSAPHSSLAIKPKTAELFI